MTRLTAACIVAAVAAPAFAQLGPINPPPGPIADTGPHLGEIEPRTPITQANTPGDANVGFIIDEPGHYFLIGNESVDAGKSGVRITASDVVLDLNGFTLSTPSQVASARGIDFTLSDQENVIIRNGTVRNFGDGGVNLPDRSVAENLRVLDCGLQGIVAGDESRVSRCLVANNTSSGTISAIEIGDKARVVNCILQDIEGDAIEIGFNSLALGNTIHAATEAGIVMSQNCIAKDNLIRSVGTIGIDANGLFAKVIGNQIDQCGTFGVEVSDDAVIDSNAVSRCENAFNQVGFCRITRNDVSFSGSPEPPTVGSSYIQGSSTNGLLAGPVNDLTSPWTNTVD